MGVAKASHRDSVESDWWDSSAFIFILAFLSTLPLLWPAIPPLTDLPGHIGRYAVQMDLAGPEAQKWYHFEWALMGNLGVDLLVELLAPLFGLILSVKMIAIAIAALLVSGMLLVAREIWGKLPATALFALPLAYCYPFQFGFINYMLSVALAFLAFALWLRLEKTRSRRFRALLFVPITMLLWLAHLYGYGIFGILAFCREVEVTLKAGRGPVQALWRSALNCLALAAPIVVTLLIRSEGAGLGAHDWFNAVRKLGWLIMPLRDQWEVFDIASALLLWGIIGYGLASRRIRLSITLTLAAGLFALLFILIPRILFGSAFADMRLVPIIMIIGLLALSPEGFGHQGRQKIAMITLAFFALRTAIVTASFVSHSSSIEHTLLALPHIPKGARLMSFVGKDCSKAWKRHRLDHMPSIALVKRHSFANDQWSLDGAQLLKVKLLEGSRWTKDPSQFVTATRCRPDWRGLDEAVRLFPRQEFDYLWIIARPIGATMDEAGLVPLWRSGADSLYRIDHTLKQSR